MRHRVLDEIAREHVIDAGVAPAAAVGLALYRGGGWQVYTGAAGRTAPSNETSPETLFDLASVSKPFLAVLCARLARVGHIDFEHTLGSLLPEARGTPVEATPIELLLSHRAGLEAHVTLSAPLERRRPLCRAVALRRAAASLRAECSSTEPPHAPIYSDLGYLLVAAAIERALGEPLDRLLATHVFDPLQLAIGSARIWLKDGGFRERVAATERMRWRGAKLRGIVHDDNNWALAGHASAGHAGLFSSVAPLLRFGVTMLDALAGRDASFLSAGEAERLVRERSGGTLRCGFDGKASDNPSAGPSASPRTFGHLGFTGTSLWCDPDSSQVSVLLSNRVNPTRSNARIRTARPLVHEALFGLGASPEQLT